MEFPEFGIIEEEPLALDTKERVVDAYVKIALTAKKPGDQIRALDKIAELRGFKMDIREINDVRSMTPEQLEQVIEELIIPSLAAYDIGGLKREIKDDVPLDN